MGLTFGDVNSRIVEALFEGGYDDKSYFGVPNGFAIVTRLAEIHSDGYPEYSNRWIAEITPISIKEFSLSKYIEALFSAPEGRYRIFVFIVTSRNMVIPSGTPVGQDEAEAWIIEGANKLPTWMESQPYTREHTCTVYIYEFIQSGHGTEANQNIPSNITGRKHLERAGYGSTREITMKISMLISQTRLTIAWVIGCVILLIVAWLQIIFGHYGENGQEVTEWLLPSIIPTPLSLLQAFGQTTP